MNAINLGSDENFPGRPRGFVTADKSLSFNGEQFTEVVADYSRELLGMGPEFLTKFERGMSEDPESATAEACVFEFLQSAGFHVEPADHPKSGGPDFACKRGADTFRADATCVKFATVESQSGIPTLPVGTHFWRTPQEPFRSKFEVKARQCAASESSAIVVAASFSFGLCDHDLREICEMALRGRVSPGYPYQGNIGLYSPERFPKNDTPLRGMFFLREAVSETGVFRGFEALFPEVSAILAARISMPPSEGRRFRVEAFGALNPISNREFDPDWLPSVPFVRLSTGWETGDLVLEERQFKSEWKSHRSADDSIVILTDWE